MKFSVIIPVYNAEKYIEECVNSVLCQTYKDFEIVLVDDGSMDDSSNICDCLKKQNESKIKVIHQENKGQLLSRCAGVEKAEGEYCICVDADDIIYENCLNILTNVIDKFSKPDIIGYKLERLEQDGRKICRDIPLKCNIIYSDKSKKNVYEKLLTTALLNSMCNKCIKRECLVGCENFFSQYESLRCSEDRLQVLEAITRAKTIVFVDEVLYSYRLFDGSVTRNYEVSQVEKFNMNLLCKVEEQYLEQWGMKSPEWQMKLEAKFLNNVAYTLLNFYENNKDNKQRTELIKYNWLSFVPQDYVENLDENPNISDFNRILWKYILNNNYLKIRFMFVKRTAYKKIRDIKRKVIK